MSCGPRATDGDEFLEAGILARDKPAGVTSHDVVAAARRELGVRRIGHAGTLDPFATGLLLVLVGRATRLQRFLLGLPKTYLATARLGWTSTTGDPDGELTETGNAPEALELPTGTIRQRVPMTSAVRVGGERLYRRAQRGERVETPEREVTVHRAELLERSGEEARYELVVSAGTYVRTLIEGLGDAYCSELRRTAIGEIGIAAGERRLEPNQALAFLPEHPLDDGERDAVGHGRAVAARPDQGRGPVRLTAGGRLVAIAEADGAVLKPRVVLMPAAAS